MLNIYKALLLHDGPITKFVLSISRLHSCNEKIDLIAMYLSNKGVQDFALLRYHSHYDFGGTYRMHSSLFSVLQLESLRLESCIFTPPTWFAGFSKLTHLRLESVVLPNDFFQNFLPKSPMLEHLTVTHCSGLGKLEIVAPFLKSFSIHGGSPDICFKCTPLLSYVSLQLSGSNAPDMVSLFASLPALQQFRVNCEILKLAPVDMNVPTRLPTLHQLKVLEVNSLVFGCPEMERVFVFLVMNSPNLHKLIVQVSCEQPYDQPTNSEVSIRRLLEVEDGPGSSDCLQHLRQFKIDYGFDQRFHLGSKQFEPELVRFVLATAPLLQRLLIKPPYGFPSAVARKFMKKVMRYKRVSKEAEVVYDSDEEVLDNEFLD